MNHLKSENQRAWDEVSKTTSTGGGGVLGEGWVLKNFGKKHGYAWEMVVDIPERALEEILEISK